MKTYTKRLSNRFFCAVTAVAMVFTMFFQSIGSVPIVFAQENYGDLIVTNYKLWVNNSELTEGKKVTVKDNDKVQLQIDWRIKNNEGLLDYSTELDTRGISLSALGSGDVYSEGVLVGTYEFEGDLFTIHLNEENTKDKSNIGGGARFDGVIDLDKDKDIENGSDQVIGVGDVDFDVIYDDRNNGSVTVDKSADGKITYEDGNYYQSYSISVNVKGMVSDINLSDTMSDSELVSGSLSVSPLDGVTINENDFTISFPDTANKTTNKSYTIKYKTKLSDEAVNNYSSIRNTAKVAYTDAAGKPKEASDTETVVSVKPSLEKTSTKLSDTYYEYSIKVDLGTAGATISDEELSKIVIHDEYVGPVPFVTWGSSFMSVAQNYNDIKWTGNWSTYSRDGYWKLIQDIPMTSFVKQEDGTYLYAYRTPIQNPYNHNGDPQGMYTGDGTATNTATTTIRDIPLSDTNAVNLFEPFYRPNMIKKVGTVNYDNGNTYEGITNANGSHNFDKTEKKTFTACIDLSEMSDEEFLSMMVLNAKLSDNAHTSCTCKSHRTDLCADCEFCSNIKISVITQDEKTCNYPWEDSSLIQYGGGMFLPSQGMTINGTTVRPVPVTVTDNSFSLDFVWGALGGYLSYLKNSDYKLFVSFDVYVDEEAVKNNEDITCDFTLDYTSGDNDYTKTWSQTAHCSQTIPWEMTVDLTQLRNQNNSSASSFFSNSKNWNKIIISDQLTDSDGNNHHNHHFNCTCKEHSYSECIDCEFCRGDNFEIVFKGSPTSTSEYSYKPYELFMDSCFSKPGWGLSKDALTVTEDSWSLDFQSLINRYKAQSGTNYNYFEMLMSGFSYITIRYNTMVDDGVDAAKQTFYNVGTTDVKIGTFEQIESGLKDKGGNPDDNWASISGADVFEPESTDWNMIKYGNDAVIGNQDYILWNLQVPFLNTNTGEIYVKAGDEIVITDTLPDGLTYNSGYKDSMTYVTNNSSGSWSAGSGNSRYYDYFTITQEGNKVIIKITPDQWFINQVEDHLNLYQRNYPTGGYYAGGFLVRIRTYYDQDNILSQPGSSVRFTNTAQMTVNGKPFKPVTATASVSKPQLISKSGTSKNVGNNIFANYRVEINKLAQDLIPDSDTLTLTDTIAKELIIQEDTFKLYKDSIADENLIDGLELVSYDKETGVATITVPDGMHLYMTYTAKLDYDPSNKNWNSSSKRNQIKIEGENLYYNSASTYTSFYSYKISVWAYEMEGEISIYKYWNNGGENTALPGAEFTLYSVYDNNGHRYTEDDEEYVMRENIKITDESGRITVENLPLDRIYKLAETKTPDGYLSGEDYYFMLQGHYGVEVPDFLADVTVAEFESGDTISYENVKYVTIEGTKIWTGDASFKSEYRPEDIQLNLYRSVDGGDEEEVKLAESDIVWDKTTDPDKWSYTVDKLPAYDKDGSEYTYRIEETAVTGYATEYDDKDITNTFETVTVNGTKTLVGDNANVRPEAVTLELYANGSAAEFDYEVEWTETDTDVWSYSIADLPKYTALGEEITYTVVETDIAEGYTASYDEAKLNITNSYEVPLTEISGTKEWIGDGDIKETVRPSDVEITLLANGEPAEFGYTVEWTDKDTDLWSYAVYNIPTRDEDGNIITYTVREENVPLGYTDAVYGFDITNTFAMDKTNVEGTKTWVGDSLENRPEDIDVKLLANGEVAEDAVPVWSGKETAIWSYAFENLDKYTYEKSEDGTIARTEIVYTVEEDVPEKYEASYSENTLDITNTRITEVEISKVAISGGEELAGASLTVKDKDGNVAETWISGEEAHVITGLTAGETYTLIEESAPDGYQIAEPIEFTVSSDGTVKKVEMIDEPIVPDDSSSESESSSSEGESTPDSSSDTDSDSSSTSSETSSTASSNTTSSKTSTISTPTTSAPSVSTPQKDDSPGTGLMQNGAMAISLLAASLFVITKKNDKK